jgi:hypothetical protein
VSNANKITEFFSAAERSAMQCSALPEQELYEIFATSTELGSVGVTASFLA